MQINRTIEFGKVSFKVHERDPFISARNFKVEVVDGERVYPVWIKLRHYNNDDEIIIKSLRQLESKISIHVVDHASLKYINMFNFLT